MQVMRINPVVCWLTWAGVLFLWVMTKTSSTGFGVFSIATTESVLKAEDDVNFDPSRPRNACIDLLDTVFMDVDDMYTAVPALSKDFQNSLMRDSAVEDLRYKLESTLDHLRVVYECLEIKTIN